jgi:hypothetical protein
MADNVAITAGSGTTIAADDVSSVFYQRVKLSIGADGSAADISGDTTNGILVDVKRIGAAENFVGFVGSKQKTVSANFTRPANTTVYAAGDAVTDSTTSPTQMTFDGVARANAGSGVIVGAVLIDSANQTTKGQFELWLFDATVTPDNDNAVFTPTDTECGTLIGVIEFNIPKVGDATSGAGGNVVYPVGNLSIPFTCGASVDDVYGLLVVRNAYTPVSGEVFTVRLQVVQN